MSIKKWLLSLLLVTSSILGINTLFLYFTDTYSIVTPHPPYYYGMANQKFAIVENIFENHKKYDTYIFGSSRVGAINPLKLKNKKTYNMTYGEGIPHEHMVILKAFMRKNISIKHLLIGLDEFSYQVSFSSHQNKFIPKSHYAATQDTKFNYYKFYFFRNIKKHDINHFKNKFIKNKIFEYNTLVYDTIFNQDIFYSDVDETDNFTKSHIKNPIFTVPKLYSGDEMDDTLNDIEEIVKLSKQNNIEVTFFINPIHHVTYASTDKKQLSEFKDRLSYITPYYDFSIPNEINNNNAYWHETSHYNYKVGNKILERIYDKNTTLKEFGIYIKKR